MPIKKIENINWGGEWGGQSCIMPASSTNQQIGRRQSKSLRTSNIILFYWTPRTSNIILIYWTPIFTCLCMTYYMQLHSSQQKANKSVLTKQFEFIVNKCKIRK